MRPGFEEAYRTGEYHQEVFSFDPFVEDVLARQRARKLQRLVSPDDSVLEYGVGTALNLRYLACDSRTGCDVCGSSREYCRRYGIEYVAELRDLQGRTFSVVLCHHVLEHLRDPLGTVCELKSALSPEGRLILYVPLETGRRYRRCRRNDRNRHLYSWNCQSLANLVAAAGLKPASVRARPYGYEQRLAPVAKLGMPTYRAALALARLLVPCDEVELVAKAAQSET